MKTGYIQTSPIFGDKKKNFEEITALAQGITADLLVLPELFATGYAFVSRDEVRSMAETADDTSLTFQFMSDLSVKTGAVVAGGFIEKEGDRYYNSSMMANGTRIEGTYRKIHLFNKEKLWFDAGDRPFGVFRINEVNIGIMICFDWIFPESCRSLALKGAQVIAHPSNLVMPYCQDAMVTRCIENRIFVVTANRVGEEKRGEDHFLFTGGSQVTAVDGSRLSAAPPDNACIGLAEIDPGFAIDKKINEFNDVLSDRRPELYENG